MASQTPPTATQQPPTGNHPVQLDRATAERFAEATRYFERAYRNAAPAPGTSSGALNWGIIARVTTTVTAASGGTYGTGVVTFQKDSGTALSDDSSMAGIAVKNLTNKAIASGSNTRVFVSWGLGSWWVVAVYDCALLS